MNDKMLAQRVPVTFPDINSHAWLDELARRVKEIDYQFKTERAGNTVRANVEGGITISMYMTANEQWQVNYQTPHTRGTFWLDYPEVNPRHLAFRILAALKPILFD